MANKRTANEDLWLCNRYCRTGFPGQIKNPIELPSSAPWDGQGGMSGDATGGGGWSSSGMGEYGGAPKGGEGGMRRLIQ